MRHGALLRTCTLLVLALPAIGCGGAGPVEHEATPTPAPTTASTTTPETPPVAAPTVAPRADDPVQALAAVYYDAVDGRAEDESPDAASSREHIEHVAHAYERLADVRAALALDDSDQRAIARAVRRALTDPPGTRHHVIGLPGFVVFLTVAGDLPPTHPRRHDVLCIVGTLSLHESIAQHLDAHDLAAEPTALLTRIRDALRRTPGDIAVLDATTLAALEPVAVDVYAAAQDLQRICRSQER